MGKSIAMESALVLDRLHDFRRAARRNGRLSLQEAPQPHDAPVEARRGVKALRDASIRLLHAPLVSAAAAPSTSDCSSERQVFMRDFFTSVACIQRTMKQSQALVVELKKISDDLLCATTQERQAALSEQLGQLVAKATEAAQDAKCRIRELSDKAAGDKSFGSSAELKIQRNMLSALASKHQELTQDLQRTQVEVKKVLERRQKYEMHLLCPNATHDEVQRMMEAGQTSSQMVMRRIAGAHAVLLDELQRVCDKHTDILRLEESIHGLARMFEEVALLVDSQGELLDDIQKEVGDAKDCTGKGVEELVVARKYQHNSRKWTCSFMVFLTLASIVILMPLISKH